MVVASYDVGRAFVVVGKTIEISFGEPSDKNAGDLIATSTWDSYAEDSESYTALSANGCMPFSGSSSKYTCRCSGKYGIRVMAKKRRVPSDTIHDGTSRPVL